jgi:hypothetical protein
MPGSALHRDELIAGLAALIERLRAAGQPAGIRIVGGAALSLRYFDRRATSDIDARIEPADEVLAIAAEIANQNGWSHDWLNTSATMFIPTVGADPGWEVIYAKDGIVIEVASPGALLAMKLNASRPTRDRRDIELLLAICGINDVEAAEDLLEGYFPGDGLPDKAIRLLEVIFEHGVPAAPTPPEVPDFG